MVNATRLTRQGVAGSGKPFTRIGIDVSLTFLTGNGKRFGAIAAWPYSGNCSPRKAFLTPQNASGMGRSSN